MVHHTAAAGPAAAPAARQDAPPSAVAAGADQARIALHMKEQEVLQLRESALKALELKLAESRCANAQLQAQMEELKSDFRYNLQLLAERDAELERLEAGAAALEGAAAAKAAGALQLRAALAQAQSGRSCLGRRLGSLRLLPFAVGCASSLRQDNPAGCQQTSALIISVSLPTPPQSKRTLQTDTKLAREGAREAESTWRAQRDDLQQRLETLKLDHADALLAQREEAAAQLRAAQRRIAEAEEEVERQRRELAAGFLLHSQELEQRWRGEAEATRHEARVARELAAQRGAEARAAHDRELEHIKRAEVGRAAGVLLLFFVCAGCVGPLGGRGSRRNHLCMRRTPRHKSPAKRQTHAENRRPWRRPVRPTRA
jgi:hypothetical protein